MDCDRQDDGNMEVEEPLPQNNDDDNSQNKPDDTDAMEKDTAIENVDELQNNQEDSNTREEGMEDTEMQINYRSGIEDIPDEVLEYIFKLISPYQDFRSCARVNRRWRNLCEQACRSKLLAFHNQITEGELLWKSVLSEQSPDNISRRHSHCAVYSDKHLCMFIFGGCTASSSTFNDLLQFDLSTRTWIRPRAIGSYPSPKALATLVTNDDILVLFGGWTHPSIYPLHQTWKLFSELHIFNIAESRWTQIKCDERDAWPPKTAGHSATLHGDKMVVFGGLTMQRGSENLSFQCSSNLWVFNLTSMTWYLQPTAGDLRPSGRYGQSQIYLDAHHLLILGGWLGTSNTDLTDVWLLHMEDKEEWRWHQLKVEGVEHKPKDISRHPAARAAKDRVVVLAKSKIASKKPQSFKGRPTMIVRNAIGSVPSSSRNQHHHHHNTSSSSEENDQVEPRRGHHHHPRGASHYHHHSHQHTNQQQQQAQGPSSHQHHGAAAPPPSGSGNQPSSHEDDPPVPGPSRGAGPGGGTPLSDRERLEREIRSGAGPSSSSFAGNHSSSSSSSSGLGLSGPPSGPPKSVKQRMLENRQRQLASLNRMEERLNKMDDRLRNSGGANSSGNSSAAATGSSGHGGGSSFGGNGAGGAHNNAAYAGAAAALPQPNSIPPVCPNHRMMMNILDTSRAISEHTVRWLPPNPKLPGIDVPQEVDLYSLVQGRTELILFGGLKKDISMMRPSAAAAAANPNNRDTSSVTNNLHVLYPYIENI
eukprot:TRINITY_DN3790_c1_g2_i3.p1 TRINITY_DN3790_c1_g2~~TRINITY_DN3790_c1_g2_i3.p1  ORF type:complete len:758 (-),score=164.78 TRINITY_DN3790_c1_g2_i3:359-2632(-)